MIYIRVVTKPVFGISMLMLLGFLVATLVVDQVSHLKREREWLSHTYVIINTIDELLLKLTEAESAQRSFILSQSESSLPLFRLLTSDQKGKVIPDPATIEGNLADLRQLISDNPLQIQRADRLESLVGQKISFMKDIVAFAPGKSLGEIKAHTGGRGIELMDEIHAIVTDMEDQEKQLLKVRTEREEQDSQIIAAICISLCVLLIVVVAAAFMAIQRELGRRRVAETALQESTAFQTTLLQSTPYAVIACDMSGTIRMFNPAAEKMLGFTADEMVGKASPAVFHDENEVIARAAELSQELGRKIEPGFEVYTSKPRNSGPELREWTYIRKDGLRFPVQLIVTPVPDGQGGISGFFGIAEDITERKRIDRMKNEFISIVSHELRTPLTSIRGSLSLILANVAGPLADKARELITIAHNNSERLVRLINDILDIEKIESGHVLMDIRPVGIGPMLRQVVDENTPYAAKYDVVLKIENELDGASVMASPDHLLQILTNLLSNAVKFSPAGGTVVLSATLSEDLVRFDVIDNGSGIPEEFQPHIFDKFTQADTSDTRIKSGTGLGLSITKALVERMQGTLAFESVPGHTVFHVGLPLAKTVPDINPASQQGSIVRKSILIVEDDQDISSLLHMILSNEGYDCRLAATAGEARRFLGQESFSAMTLDLKLPDEDGLTLINELRLDPQTIDLPIIVISIRAEEGRNILNWSAVGIVDWLQKPIDIERLRNVLRGLFSPVKTMPSILHVEDDPDMAEILSLSMTGKAAFFNARTMTAAHRLLSEHNFDLAILDIELPDGNGLDLIQTLVGRSPPVPIIILSASETPLEVQKRVETSLVKSVVSEQKIVDIVLGLISGRISNAKAELHPLY